jgi:Na+/H+ antiporter NhaC
MTEMNPPAAGAVAAGAPYVANAEIERQESYTRFLPLIKWLLVLPHFLVLTVLYIGVFVAWIISFFAVIITGRFPRGLWNFIVGTYRWTWRATAYYLLMTDRYPPFTLDEVPDYPARLDVEYPETVARWRPLVHWILIIPYAIIGYVLGLILYVLIFVAFWAILFTKKFPEGLFDLSRGFLQWQYRAGVYTGFLVTRYPPFTLD